MSNRAAWFHCFSGIAGDMALGALVDAGADLSEIKKTCEQLRLLDLEGNSEWELEAVPSQRNGIAATQIRVICDGGGTARTAKEIFSLLENADLPERVRHRSLAAFQILAEAEGKLHSKPPDEVHFHEVGGVDAIIDIVGTAAALENLQIDKVYSSPAAQGTGMIDCEHGRFPNPPPAVAEILKDTPVFGVDIPYELTTPTGAALLKALVEPADFGALPEIHIEASGFGAGTREIPELPNLTQVIIGTTTPTGTPPAKGQPVVLLETNLDDITGEVLADTIAHLLEAGAHDVWATPIIMKKGRPAHTLSVLVDPALKPHIADLLFRATGSLGVRAAITQTLDRWPQPRHTQTLEIEGHLVRVKISGNSKTDPQKTGAPKTGTHIKGEYEDMAAAAKATGKSLKEIQEMVIAKFKSA